jgi:hypothetical protein
MSQSIPSTTPRRFIPACASLLLALAACGGGGGGGGGGGNGGSVTPPVVVTPPPTQGPARGITVLAGQPGGLGTADGPVGRFGNLSALAMDRSGVIYVGDVYNNAGTVRTVSLGTGGDAMVTTYAHGDPGPPTAIAVDASGSLLAMIGNRIVRLAPNGSQALLAGAWIDGTADGQGEQARFSSPKAMLIDEAGLLWVADGQAIRTVTAGGEVRTHRAATAALTDGSVVRSPTGLAFDNAGNLVIAVAGAPVRKMTPAGARLDTALNATSVAGDRNGNLYGFDQCALYKADAGGRVGLLAGAPTRRGAVDGPGAEASFGADWACDGRIMMDVAGNVLVSDTINGALRKVTPAGVVGTVAGKAAQPGLVDGTGSAARFRNPDIPELVFDNKDSLYLIQEGKLRKVSRAGAVSTVDLPKSDAGGHPLSYLVGGLAYQGRLVAMADRVLYEIGDNGSLRALAGSPVVPHFTDGTGTQAGFSDLIREAARDGNGNLYLLEDYAHRGPDGWTDWAETRIRKVTPGGVVTTVYAVPHEDKRPQPWRVWADRQGNVFTLGAPDAVLRIATDGSTSTVATGLPLGISLTVDADGKLTMITEQGQPATVEKIGPAGQRQLVAGRRDQIGLITGDLPGSMNLLYGVAVDDQGVVYVLTENAVVKIVP